MTGTELCIQMNWYYCLDYTGCMTDTEISALTDAETNGNGSHHIGQTAIQHY